MILIFLYYLQCSTSRAAVNENGLVLEYASEELQAVRDIVLEAVKVNRCVLENLSDGLQADRNIFLAAMMIGGCALEYAYEELQAELHVVFAAVKEDRHALEFTFEELESESPKNLGRISGRKSNLGTWSKRSSDSLYPLMLSVTS